MVTVTYADGAPQPAQKTTENPGVTVTYADAPADVKTAQGSFRALRAGLLKREKDGRLGPEGRKVLDLVNSRAVVDGGLGAFVQGLVMNGSDEAIAGITSALGGGDELVKAINQFRSKEKLPALSRYEANLARERVGGDRAGKSVDVARLLPDEGVKLAVGEGDEQDEVLPHEPRNALHHQFGRGRIGEIGKQHDQRPALQFGGQRG